MHALVNKSPWPEKLHHRRRLALRTFVSLCHNFVSHNTAMLELVEGLSPALNFTLLISLTSMSTFLFWNLFCEAVRLD